MNFCFATRSPRPPVFPLLVIRLPVICIVNIFFSVCCLSFKFMDFFDVYKLQMLIFSYMDFCFDMQESCKYSCIFFFSLKLHFLKFKSSIYLEFDLLYDMN